MRRRCWGTDNLMMSYNNPLTPSEAVRNQNPKPRRRGAGAGRHRGEVQRVRGRSREARGAAALEAGRHLSGGLALRPAAEARERRPAAMGGGVEDAGRPRHEGGRRRVVAGKGPRYRYHTSFVGHIYSNDVY